MKPFHREIEVTFRRRSVSPMLHDAGMLQTSQDARLTLEPSFDIGRCVVQYFERDGLAVRAVACPIHRAHPALSGQIFDFEAMREESAGGYHGVGLDDHARTATGEYGGCRQNLSAGHGCPY